MQYVPVSRRFRTTSDDVSSPQAAEDMFRRAVLTFEGVKCDSLFDYFPPLNLLALTVMWPISQVTSPRWFHKISEFVSHPDSRSLANETQTSPPRGACRFQSFS